MEKIHKILVPIDFSEISERVLQLAVLIAKTYKAELFCVFVAENVMDYSGFALTDLPIINFDEESLNNARKRLKNYAEQHLEKSSVPFQSTLLEGEVGTEIVTFSKTNSIDLIIIGTHGYKGFKKMFLGSVTDKVLKLAPCPVLTTR